MKTLKTIVAGPRVGATIEQVRAAIQYAPWKISEIVSGKAKGVDTFGEIVANEEEIPIKEFPAKWKDIEGKPEHLIKSNAYGEYYVKAGFDRNEEMAKYADALIAIDTGSSGTANMIKLARKHKLEIYILEVPKGSEN